MLSIWTSLKIHCEHKTVKTCAVDEMDLAYMKGIVFKE